MISPITKKKKKLDKENPSINPRAANLFFSKITVLSIKINKYMNEKKYKDETSGLCTLNEKNSDWNKFKYGRLSKFTIFIIIGIIKINKLKKIDSFLEKK